MSEHLIQIPVPLDADGFMSFECPHCETRFKLLADEAQDESVYEFHCPICGLGGEPDSFWTSDAVEAAHTAAQNMATDIFYQEMKKLERKTRGKGLVQFKAGRAPKPEPQMALIEDEGYEAHTFDCCEKSAKVHPTVTALTLKCPYCGLPQ